MRGEGSYNANALTMCDGCDKQKEKQQNSMRREGEEQKREVTKFQLKNALETKTAGAALHTIGFTASHDARLLGDITSIGTTQGIHFFNFFFEIYFIYLYFTSFFWIILISRVNQKNASNVFNVKSSLKARQLKNRQNFGLFEYNQDENVKTEKAKNQRIILYFVFVFSF